MTRSRERALIVRSALDKATRSPYSKGRHNCFQVVKKVVKAVNRDVKPPKTPNVRLHKLMRIIRQAGGVYPWVLHNLDNNSGFTYGPDIVRPGDVWICELQDSDFGGLIGVFDPCIHPVHWTEQSHFETLDQFPCHIWTYPDG